jgi:hypothetical protein
MNGEYVEGTQVDILWALAELAIERREEAA